MATQLKLRRDTSADLALVTPVEAEPGYDQTNKRLIVGDGATAGGIPHASYADVQNQEYTYAQASGVNSITFSVSPSAGTYQEGQSYSFKAASSNTGSVTVNINSIGSRNIKKMTSAGKAVLEADDIVSGGIYTITYDSSEFILSGGVASKAGIVLLQEETTSASSQLAITTSIDSTYDVYKFVIDYLYPATDGANLTAQVYSASAWQTSSNYKYSYYGVEDATAVAGGVGTATSSIVLADSVETTQGFAASGIVYLFKPSSTTYQKRIMAEMQWYADVDGTTSRDNMRTTTGRWGDTAAVTGLRFIASSGNISGSVRMYGLRA